MTLAPAMRDASRSPRRVNRPSPPRRVNRPSPPRRVYTPTDDNECLSVIRHGNNEEIESLMKTLGTRLVKVGKYKGQPFRNVLSYTSYVYWLSTTTFTRCPNLELLSHYTAYFAAPPKNTIPEYTRQSTFQVKDYMKSVEREPQMCSHYNGYTDRDEEGVCRVCNMKFH